MLDICSRSSFVMALPDLKKKVLIVAYFFSLGSSDAPDPSFDFLVFSVFSFVLFGLIVGLDSFLGLPSPSSKTVEQLSAQEHFPRC